MLFLNFYFKPVLKDKLKATIILDSNGICGFDKSNLELEFFMVQHDMENIYMWVLKEKPENALGKMQLRSYMNGHSRQGDRPFPFSVDRGFVQSHRMQRKHYRGLTVNVFMALRSFLHPISRVLMKMTLEDG
ncbi:HSP20-like chaperones superfamily protein [Abeliophyllum distichum]|uniref:HSP20-like chaperones superfamily protein n=1 Tax=Abeliophyllum distichum TaxID=126358 RepID=A0ABD1PBR7_9LAMI